MMTHHKFSIKATVFSILCLLTISQASSKTVTYTTDYYKLAQSGTKEEIVSAFKERKDLGKQVFGMTEETFLMMVLKNDRDLQIVKTVVNGESSIQAKDADGKTPIMYASKYSSSPEVLEYLIKHGTTFNIGVASRVQQIDYTGHTAFDYAKENAEPKILETLQKYGKDVSDAKKDKANRNKQTKGNVNNEAGGTAKTTLFGQSNTETKTTQEQEKKEPEKTIPAENPPEPTEKEAAKEKPVETKAVQENKKEDSQKKTKEPMKELTEEDYYRLAQIGSREEIISAFKQNPKLGAQTFGEEKETFLMLALKNNRELPVVKTILYGDSSVLAQNSQNKTPVMYAAQYTTDLDLLEYLIKYGTTLGIGVSARVQAIDKTGHSPFDYAKMNPTPGITYVLEKYGKEPSAEKKNKVYNKYNPGKTADTTTEDIDDSPIEELEKQETGGWTINSSHWRFIGSANITDNSKNSEQPETPEPQETTEPEKTEEKNEPEVEEIATEETDSDEEKPEEPAEEEQEETVEEPETEEPEEDFTEPEVEEEPEIEEPEEDNSEPEVNEEPEQEEESEPETEEPEEDSAEPEVEDEPQIDEPIPEESIEEDELPELDIDEEPEQEEESEPETEEPEEDTSEPEAEEQPQIDEPIPEESVEEDELPQLDVDEEPRPEESVVEDELPELDIDEEPETEEEPQIDEPIPEESVEEDELPELDIDEEPETEEDSAEPEVEEEPQIDEPIPEESVEEDELPELDIDEEPETEENSAEPEVEDEPQIDEPIPEESVEEDELPELDIYEEPKQEEESEPETEKPEEDSAEPEVEDEPQIDEPIPEESVEEDELPELDIYEEPKQEEESEPETEEPEEDSVEPEVEDEPQIDEPIPEESVEEDELPELDIDEEPETEEDFAEPESEKEESEHESGLITYPSYGSFPIPQQNTDKRETPSGSSSADNSKPQEKHIEFNVDDPDSADEYGVTLLMKAAKSGNDWDLTNLLERGADVQKRDSDGWTALMYAVRYQSNMDIVRKLLDAGAYTRVRNKYNATPLLMAADYTQNPQILATLLEGRSIAEDEVFKAFILSITSTFGSQHIKNAKIKLFLDRNIAINQVWKGKTPLIYACQYADSIEVLSLLINSGADKTFRDADGKTALDYALENPKLKAEKVKSLLSTTLERTER